jgi:hypothetical protein
MIIAASRTSSRMMHLAACGRRFSLECADAQHRGMLEIAFNGLKPDGDADQACAVSLGRISRSDGSDCQFEPPGARARSIASHADLIYEVDKALTLALQHARPDLLFLHAAAVELDGRAVVLCGPSGAGKSTITFALLHHGFGYMSDELAPIDVAKGLVLPYAHALCLKHAPPAPYHLPELVLDAGETLHVPVAALPDARTPRPRPLGALLFLRREHGAPAPRLRPLTIAAASARLLSNALNVLAHRDLGVDAALAIARSAPAYLLDIGSPQATVAAVRATLAR